MIIKVHEYFDDRGAKITENELISGEICEDMARFIGYGMLQMKTPMGVIPQEITVPIEADSIEEAFEKFESVMNEARPKAIEEMKQMIRERMEQEQSKIVVPTSMPSKNPLLEK